MGTVNICQVAAAAQRRTTTMCRPPTSFALNRTCTRGLCLNILAPELFSIG